ncbi:hypothetical protein H4V97_002519 [Flavobacterium sp. CG_23.5]|uniref:Lipoprotein n=1 Tax=Flavobacterium xueshanense TaxID=935223 RepID=A0A1I1Z228_9FLAO|nr:MULTISPECIES: DUF6252 family protein [Flavobacterium]MBG6110283.1 hypothetical protein [Flavobacterium sp. CG_9.10]MBP2284201.1 hypothetical protein [Flavobacterium sp. CG_23.5]SFE25747.1 hypothetical protein SAMN04488131_101218 [Flavobacterium xueshanense]
MKNLLFLFATVLILSCCSTDDNKPKKPIDQLPPATQTGANTAGCLINGEAFLPKGTGIILNCLYQDGLNFGLRITENMNDTSRSIYISTLNQNLEIGKIYDLQEYNSKWGQFVVFTGGIGKDDYRTTLTITGELKITNHNFSKAILSGTFWFDAVNSKGEKIQVREGRFDMEY